jgi:signal transduction histidine kinase
MTAADRLERLLSASLLLTSELSLERVLQRVTDIAVEVIGARFAAIGVLASDGRMLESFTVTGMTAAEREQIGPPPRGHGILGLVIRENRVVRLPDLTQHPDSAGFPPHHPPMHSFLGVPIAGRQGIFGNLYLTEKTGGGLFTDEDEHIALLLAAQTAAAVDNARLHEQSARLLGEVQQLQRSRERFFAMVNHELRNSIAGVYGWAEMLVRRKDPTTVPRAAFEVLEAAEQATALVSDLLDLSRLDEDRLRPHFTAVDPVMVARRAVARCTPAATQQGIVLEVQPAPMLPPCRTDAHRVEQILVNLLTNAIRHARVGGHVTVAVRRNGPMISLVVDDDGPGIAAEDVERIFDIYETKATEEGRGIGLGLPLSRRLARLLDGELTAVHRPEGGGRVVLELPAIPVVDAAP